MIRLRRAAVAAALLLGVAHLRPAVAARQQTPPPAAAQPGQPQQPTFRVRIDSVSVDVQVTDKQGRPVLDLTQQDFDVRESGKPQAIDTFKLIKLDDSPVDAASIPDITSIEDQRREAAQEDRRIIVLFLDDYHTHRADAMRFRNQLAQWVQSLNPRDLVAVMTPLMPIGLLTLTHDRDAVAAQVRGFEGRKYDYTPRNPVEVAIANAPPELIEQQRNSITIGSLDTLCAYLGTLREGRKFVIYASEGLTGSVPSATIAGVGRAQPMSTGSFTSIELQHDLEEVFASAARSNTLIYTVDPRGLAANATEPADPVQLPAQLDRQLLSDENDSLRIIADQTGGRAFVSSNDPLPSLGQVIRDSSSYYLLSYTSTEKPRDGKFHPISVKVARKDVDVRARKGYWAYSAAEVAKLTAPPRVGPPLEVQQAVDTLEEPTRDHPMRVWVGATRGAGGKSAVTLSWEATGTSTSADDTVDHLKVTATSVYGDTVYAGNVTRDPAAVRPEGVITFETPPGAVRVRIVAENAKGLRLDTDDRDVDVPDFTSVGPLITTPMIFRARTAREVAQLRAQAAPIPSATREFSRTERLLLRFQAFGPGGTAPTIAMKLLNQRGQPMADLPAPTRTPDGTFESEIGLGSLAPADYIIEITATSGEAGKKVLVAVRIVM